MKIKKNDNVLVISGKYRGKSGKVEKVSPKKNQVMVAGVNIMKKSTKHSKKAPKGGIIEITVPVPVSNVMIICNKCNKPVRVSYKLINNKKTRICKKCSEQL